MRNLVFMSLLGIVILLLLACGEAATPVPPTNTPAPPPTAVPPTNTPAPAQATEAPAQA